jgi:hypothetical protein
MRSIKPGLFYSSAAMRMLEASRPVWLDAQRVHLTDRQEYDMTE